MKPFFCMVTNIGRAKLAEAAANGDKLRLVTGSVGDGAGVTPTPSSDQTALARETYRSQLNRLFVDSAATGRLIAELLVPSDIGGFTVREVGIWDVEGDLIAVCNFPATYKPEPIEGATKDLLVRVALQFSSTDNIELTLSSAVVIASRQWVVDNFISAPGGTTGQLLRKRTNADGDVEWFDLDIEGLNIQLGTIEEVQELAADQTIVNWATLTTQNTGYYIGGQRLLPSEFTITGPAQITLAQSRADGTKIHGVQNDQTAGIPEATELVPGLAEFATTAETAAGARADRAVHPQGLAAHLAERNYLRAAENLSDLIDKAAARLALDVERYRPKASVIFDGSVAAGNYVRVPFNYIIPANSSLMEIWWESTFVGVGSATRNPVIDPGAQFSPSKVPFGKVFWGAQRFSPGQRHWFQRLTGNGPGNGLVRAVSAGTDNNFAGTTRNWWKVTSPNVSTAARSGTLWVPFLVMQSWHNVESVSQFQRGRWAVNFKAGTFSAVASRQRYAVPHAALNLTGDNSSLAIGLSTAHDDQAGRDGFLIQSVDTSNVLQNGRRLGALFYEDL